MSAPECADVRVPPRRNHLCPCGSGKKFKLCCERKAAPSPSPLVVDAPSIAEINLERAFVGFGADMTDYLANSDPGERVVHAGDVLREMETAWRSGVRTVLVNVDSGGGQVEGGVVLFDALRAWRAAGGRVVVFLAGLAGSTASWWPLSADVIVAHKSAAIYVHGPSRGLGDHVTAAKRAIYRTSTLAPADLLETWITTPSTPDGHGVTRLDAHRALELGFVDFVGSRGRARECALALASGGDVSSPRRAALSARGELQEFAEELAVVRTWADALRRSLAPARPAGSCG
jgi:ATP-dependent protease ClpP protease subunit